jgi:hypothetical protein
MQWASIRLLEMVRAVHHAVEIDAMVDSEHMCGLVSEDFHAAAKD